MENYKQIDKDNYKIEEKEIASRMHSSLSYPTKVLKAGEKMGAIFQYLRGLSFQIALARFG